MIKPEELMSNNVVELLSPENPVSMSTGIFVKIVSIDCFEVSYCFLGKPIAQQQPIKTHIKNIQSIELTPEILIRLGFENIQELACWLDDELVDYPYNIEVYNDEGVEYLKKLPLHKLQNLVSVLTGKQLTLKEE